MSKLYRIKNWEENFENNRTRLMKQMLWVPVPNKHDGDGYTELVDRENGAAMLGAWIAILQVASKCAMRGTLMRDNGSPHAPKSIARLTRLDESTISEAITLLCSADVGWLEVVDSKQLACRCQEGAGFAHPTDEEGKGIEGKGIEEKEGEEGSAGSQMVRDVINSRPEFRNLKPESILQAIHDAGTNPRLQANHEDFIRDMANSLEPPKIPVKLYARYLQSDGRGKKTGSAPRCTI